MTDMWCLPYELTRWRRRVGTWVKVPKQWERAIPANSECPTAGYSPDPRNLNRALEITR
jgi:hypothetical protein